MTMVKFGKLFFFEKEFYFKRKKFKEKKLIHIICFQLNRRIPKVADL